MQARKVAIMEKGGVMTRKDSEKDAERPHYYSQFWLDIAAGRRVIGGPKPEEAETGEPDVPEPAPIRKTGRNSAAASDGYKAAHASPVAARVVEEPETEPEDIGEAEIPNILVGEETDFLDEETPEEDFLDEETDEEEFFEEEDEEEEEGGDWSPRGRKKAKPVRPVKPVNKPKRPPRRSF